MMKEEFKAGHILTVEHGVYDDYRSDGPWKIIKDFNVRDVSKEYIEGFRNDPVHKDMYEDLYWRQGIPEDRDQPRASCFVEWLVNRGYIEAIENCRSIWIGDVNFSEEDMQL